MEPIRQDMVDGRLRLTAVGEGLSTSVHTHLRGADSPQAVIQALTSLFPDIILEAMEPEPVFGKAIDSQWQHNDVSMATFLQRLHDQRILDTALDAMSINLDGKRTSFRISRLAACAGKISFPIPGETPLGGVITVALEGEGLEDWLHAATWHAGRSQVPRTINDERSMGADGEAQTWI